jgi:uncharacterized protein YciW
MAAFTPAITSLNALEVVRLNRSISICLAQLISYCAFQLGENAVLTGGKGDRVARNLWSDRKSPQLLM